MKPHAFFVLAGACALAGCSSQQTVTPPKSHPKPTTEVALASITPASHAPRPASTVGRPSSHPTSKPAVHIATGADPYKQGLTYLHVKNYRAAQVAFRTAIARHDKLVQSEIGLGSADLGLRQYAAASAAYRKAADAAPRNSIAVFNAADAALAARDYHGAVRYASRYIALHPRDVKGYRLRFFAYGRLLDGKHELVDARKIAQLQPRSADAFDNLGIALANDNKYQQSVQAFTRAIQLSPGMANYYTNRAIAESLEKKPKLVLADLETARRLTHNPTFRHKIDQAIASLKKRTHV